MAAPSQSRAPRTFREIIDLWPSIAEFARTCRFRDETVRAWILRGNIPVDQWDVIIQTARELGIHGVSVDVLMGAMRINRAERDERRRREAAGLPASDDHMGPTGGQDATGTGPSSLVAT